MKLSRSVGVFVAVVFVGLEVVGKVWGGGGHEGMQLPMSGWNGSIKKTKPLKKLIQPIKPIVSFKYFFLYQQKKKISYAWSFSRHPIECFIFNPINKEQSNSNNVQKSVD